ncbi:flagellar motor switch phosphatase FliY [Paenibacillus taiwanensis]|uniref:flagellar motor switch phosphatase FliY n=1 Tax=Paenibacillus taiwanensis TaxID=401638 RepID=UPI00041F87D0|nr:flagellar motor switch phosphatase FliY [Paenibacillus taiwanensis]
MTSKEYLSQEEIDALLRKSGEDSVEATPTPSVEQFLTPLEIDALGEIGNITFGSAATALSTLLGRKVDITTPIIKLLDKKNLESEFPHPHVAVHVHYVDGFQGVNSLVIKTSDAQIIADLMLGGDGRNVAGELNEIHISAVQEAMNQMMGSSATSMSTIFNQLVNISPPGIGILNAEKGEGNEMLPEDDVLIKISFRLTIGDLIDSTIMQLLTIPFAKDMVNRLMGAAEAMAKMETEAATAVAVEQPVSSGQVPNTQAQPTAMPNHYEEHVGGGYPVNHESYPNAPQQQANMHASMNAHQGSMHGHYAAASMGTAPSRPVNVQPVQFANLQTSTYVPADDSNINLLLDIPLRVTVELGRTHKQIKDILELSQGSIIELDKLAGEPVDILVNNKLIAKGEVVVIDENFGVRVTDIINQWDRIQKLQ